MIVNPRNGSITYTQKELMDTQLTLENIRDEAMKEGRMLEASLIVELADSLSMYLTPRTKAL